jgi:dipeptidyl-peptidase-4
MKKKFIIVLGWLLVFGLSSAQLKTITLEESVLQQNRKFGADRMTGFQWIPGSTDYVYYTNAWTKMMQASATNVVAKEGITQAEINAALGIKISNFFGVQWIDNSHILVSENGKYYQYNRETKTGKLLFSLPEEAENTTPDAAKQKMAYTKGNNLYFHSGSQEIAVTQESSLGIVSGQSISRNEFGISGGIFW